MTELSDQALLHDTLPSAWAPVLERVAALDALVTRAAGSGEPTAEQRAEASVLRARLLEHAGELHEPLPASLHAHGSGYGQWFTQAALLWASFAEAGGEVLIDTVGARSLARFPVDFRPSDADRSALRGALGEVFGFAPALVERSERSLAHVTSNLRVKQALTAGLRATVQAHGAGDLRRGALHLLQELYGPVPFRAGDVDLVLTSSAVFVCVPYADGGLKLAGYAERPAAERDAIGAFVARVEQANQSLKSVRFPAFGLFDETAISPALRAQLHAAVRAVPELAGIADQAIAATLRTMVSVLPTHEVDKYIVHDAWGHGWQETLCEFEWEFDGMPRLGEPLRLDSAGPFAPGGRTLLADAFEVVDGATALRPQVLLHVIELDLRERIRVGANLVVSEALADLIEHKAVRAGEPLPSSSLLPAAPLKLDLSLTDAKRMQRAWRKAYRALRREPERARLCEELRARGFPAAGCAQAVEQAAALIEARFACAFDDSLAVSAAHGDRVRCNTLQRIVLGMLAFDAALERFLAQADAHHAARVAEHGPLPLARCPAVCIDLLVLLLAWFYEQDRTLHVWHLDELLRGAFLPTLLELEACLAARGASIGAR